MDLVQRSEKTILLVDGMALMFRAYYASAATGYIRRTKAGHCVNLVTPGALGDPREWLIPRLSAMVKDAGLAVREIRYIDECGCGGHVTRVYR